MPPAEKRTSIHSASPRFGGTQRRRRRRKRRRRDGKLHVQRGLSVNLNQEIIKTPESEKDEDLVNILKEKTEQRVNGL